MIWFGKICLERNLCKIHLSTNSYVQISKKWTFDPALKVKSDLLSRLVGRDYGEGTLAFTGHSSLISEKGSN